MKVQSKSGTWLFGTIRAFYGGRKSGNIMVYIDGRLKSQPIGVQYISQINDS